MPLVVHVIRHVMPDGRLANVTVTDHSMTFAHRFGHIHPLVVAELNAVSRYSLESGAFGFEPWRLGGWSQHECWMELVPDKYMPHGRHLTFRVRSSEVTVPGFELGVREGMIDVALLREMNDTVLPAATAVLPLTCGRIPLS